MATSSTASEMLSVDQQRAHKVPTAAHHREWLTRFALLLGLIALALTVAALLANLPGALARSTGAGRRILRASTPDVAEGLAARFQSSDRASSLDLGRSPGRGLSPSKPAAQSIPAEWAEQMERLARLVH